MRDSRVEGLAFFFEKGLMAQHPLLTPLCKLMTSCGGRIAAARRQADFVIVAKKSKGTVRAGGHQYAHRVARTLIASPGDC